MALENGNAVKSSTLLGFLLAIVLFWAALNVIVFLGDGVLAQEFSLPMLMIDGAVIMIGVLGFAAIVFSTFNLHDRSQALALPEGSIRAVIAVMLIVMFAILAIYLFTAIQGGSVRMINHVSSPVLEGLAKNPDIQILSTEMEQQVVSAQGPSETGTKKLPPLSSDASEKDANHQSAYVNRTRDNPTQTPFYTVVISEKTSEASSDLAKQLVVLLGTLVTSISSFYFGSRAVASKNRDPDEPVAIPSDVAVRLLSIFPPSRASDGETSEHSIQGTGLETVKSITLVNNATRIPIDILEKRDHQIIISISAHKDMQSGSTWTIEAGREDVRLPPLLLEKALTITGSGAP